MEARTQGAQDVSKGKAMFALAIGMLAFVAGLYLSGYLTLLLLQLDAAPKWHTYLDYWRVLDLPQARPHAGKIKWAGYLGFGAPAAAWVAPLVLILKPPSKSLHGEARFATAGDLAQARPVQARRQRHRRRQARRQAGAACRVSSS